MAYRVAPKLTSTTHDTYRHPHFDQLDYKYYHPQLFTSKVHHYAPDKGTREFFHDYRRSHISEKTLQRNLEKFQLQTPLRPTWESDKPDRVLGRRKFDREALFPVIHNNPVYTLSNRIPDRERDRDKKFMEEAAYHRLQYKDLTGSLHTQSPFFHCPDPASKVFIPKTRQTSFHGEYPSSFRSVEESTYGPDREKPLVNHMTTDVA
eukprot:gene13745-4667_t